MDTYDAHCDEHGTYPLNPELRGCPHCKIDAMRAGNQLLREERDALKAQIIQYENVSVDESRRIAELEAEKETCIACGQWSDLVEELQATIGRLSARGIEDMQDEIRQLQATIKRMRPLVQEIIDIHADPDMAEYNECDTAPCQWCEEMKKALGDKV